MLEHEWRELETLCERISDLRHRQSHALRSRNVGLVEGLREDVARMRRQREQLVQHISTRLAAGGEHQENARAGPKPGLRAEAHSHRGWPPTDPVRLLSCPCPG